MQLLYIRGFSKDGAEEELGIGLDAAKWLVSKVLDWWGAIHQGLNT